MSRSPKTVIIWSFVRAHFNFCVGFPEDRPWHSGFDKNKIGRTGKTTGTAPTQFVSLLHLSPVEAAYRHICQAMQLPMATVRKMVDEREIETILTPHFQRAMADAETHAKAVLTPVEAQDELKAFTGIPVETMLAARLAEDATFCRKILAQYETREILAKMRARLRSRF